MNRKFIAIALATVSVAFLFASCGKKEGFNKEETQKYEPIEFTTNENGDKFIQNQFGDLIPVTTGKDGSMELVDDLYTKPKEQADKEEASIKQEEAKHPSGDKTTVPSTQPNGENQKPQPKPDPNQPETTTSGGLQIGQEAPDENRDAVIVW